VAKGSAFENHICRELSLWWTDGARKDIFGRTRGSGGKLGRGGSKWEGGDIGFVDPIGEPLIRYVNVEAKTGYATKTKLTSGKTRETNWCILDLIDSNLKEPTLQGMWSQCEEDALISGREPWLIFRRYRRKTSIAFFRSFYGLLGETFGYPNVSVPRAVIQWTESGKDGTPIRIMIMALDDFFDWIPDIRPALPLTPRIFVP
jgi:hypothetical protein